MAIDSALDTGAKLIARQPDHAAAVSDDAHQLAREYATLPHEEDLESVRATAQPRRGPRHSHGAVADLQPPAAGGVDRARPRASAPGSSCSGPIRGARRGGGGRWRRGGSGARADCLVWIAPGELSARARPGGVSTWALRLGLARCSVHSRARPGLLRWCRTSARTRPALVADQVGAVTEHHPAGVPQVELIAAIAPDLSWGAVVVDPVQLDDQFRVVVASVDPVIPQISTLTSSGLGMSNCSQQISQSSSSGLRVCAKPRVVIGDRPFQGMVASGAAVALGQQRARGRDGADSPTG